MRLLARSLMAVVGTIGLVAGAQAKGDTQNFEIAGFGGWAMGGEFKLENGGAVVNNEVTSTGSRIGLLDHLAYGFAADIRASDSAAYELFYSREPTRLSVINGVAPMDVTVSYLQLGGTLMLDEGERAVRPYAVGGLGITRLSPGEDGNTRTRFSGSLGFGLRWAATQHLALRLEGRGFVTLMNNDSVFCKSDQSGLACLVHSNSTTFIQGQLLAGVAFTF